MHRSRRHACVTVTDDGYAVAIPTSVVTIEKNVFVLVPDEQKGVLKNNRTRHVPNYGPRKGVETRVVEKFDMYSGKTDRGESLNDPWQKHCPFCLAFFHDFRVPFRRAKCWDTFVAINHMSFLRSFQPSHFT